MNTPSSTAPRIVLIPEKSALPTQSSTSMSFLLKIAAPEAPALDQASSAAFKGLNLALVLDRSGSMASQSRMPQAKLAAHAVVKQLGTDDCVSLVVFSDEVKVLASGCTGRDQELLHNLIEGINPGGCTNLHDGWLAGAHEVAKHFRTGALNRVLILSDGMTNRGVVQQALILERVASMNRTGISTTTLGVGLSFNEDLLQAMAEAGDGNYHFAETAEELPDMFGAELREQRLVTGTQVAVRFRKAPGVRLHAPLNGLPTTRNDGYMLGNLVAGKEHRLVFDAVLPADQSRAPLFEVAVEYRDAAGEIHEVTLSLNLPRIADAAFEALPANPEVGMERALLEAAHIKHLAANALDAGRRHQAEHLLFEAQSLLSGWRQVPAAARMMVSIDRQSEQISRGEIDSSKKNLKSESARQRRKSDMP